MEALANLSSSTTGQTRTSSFGSCRYVDGPATTVSRTLRLTGQILFAQEIVTPVVLTLTKFSILAMYWRLFPTPFIRRSCIAVACVIAAWCIAVILPGIFRCDPVYKAWNPFMTTGTCSTAIGDWIAWQDAIPEFVILATVYSLPVYEVWRLSSSWRNRIAISAGLVFAGMSIISSIVRFGLAFKIHDYGGTTGGGDATRTYPDSSFGRWL